KGTSYAWFRYFMSVFPITVAFFSYELKQTKLKTFARFLMFGGLIASAALLTYTLTQPDIAPDENSYVYRTNHVEDMRVEREMARYFDENMPDATIMVDSSTAYTLILASKIPQKFVITSDSLFKESISDPYVYDIEYMLLPRPYTGGPISAINIAYPNLYNQGAPWVEKAMDFGDGRWRMYKVISSQNALPSVENKPQAETPTTEQGTEGNPDEHMLEQEREPSIEQQEQAPEQPFLQSDEQGSEQT
ncbi:MAG: hypothetical protein K0Q59_5771, partial [Paenibacillus sp.]|nr:hypothetical protein [Paenibacillus sp.]